MEEKVLSKELKERLEKYPALKGYVESFIHDGGMNPDPELLSDLVVYVRELDIDVPSFFNWDYETTEDFDSWGWNSRYMNVFEPLLFITIPTLLSYSPLSTINLLSFIIPVFLVNNNFPLSPASSDGRLPACRSCRRR